MLQSTLAQSMRDQDKPVNGKQTSRASTPFVILPNSFIRGKGYELVQANGSVAQHCRQFDHELSDTDFCVMVFIFHKCHAAGLFPYDARPEECEEQERGLYMMRYRNMQRDIGIDRHTLQRSLLRLAENQYKIIKPDPGDKKTWTCKMTGNYMRAFIDYEPEGSNSDICIRKYGDYPLYSRHRGTSPAQNFYNKTNIIKSGDFTRADLHQWDNPEYSMGARKQYITMCMHANKKTNKLKIRIKKLAAIQGCSRSTVKRRMLTLQALGMVLSEPRVNACSIYTVRRGRGQ